MSELAPREPYNPAVMAEQDQAIEHFLLLSAKSPTIWLTKSKLSMNYTSSEVLCSLPWKA
jgi:hypothetical protein